MLNKMKKLSLMGFLILMASTINFGQSIFGTIRGIVSDSNGAAIAGATVTITEEQTKISLTQVSNGEGYFELSNLKAGIYLVAIKKDGFKEFSKSKTVLNARETLRVDAQLETGQVTEVVNVRGGESVINTESQTVSSSLKSNQLLSLPTNYRGSTSTSPYQALAYLPGVQTDNSFGFQINGALPGQTEVSVDGISTVNIRSNGPLRENFPSTETISELKVQAVGNNAEFSQLGDITTTSKGGTNQYHGSGFWYHQNDKLDSRNPFSFAAKPLKNANTFGGSLGGSIIKDRLFFFGAYEGLNFKQQRTIRNTVPSASARAGQLATAIRNPFTPTPNGTGFTYTNFANNLIPDNLISPFARRILSLYPLPNTPTVLAGGTQGIFEENRQAPIKSNQFDVRIDYELTKNQSIFGRYSQKIIDSTVPQNLLLPSRIATERNRNLVVSHNWRATSNILNEFRVGYTFRDSVSLSPLNEISFVNSLGLVGLGNLKDDQLTNVGVSGGLTGIGIDRSAVNSRNLQITDNLTWVVGRHTLKFGGDFRKIGTQDTLGFIGGDDAGSFSFDGTFTGNGFADFLLGVPVTSAVAVTTNDVDGNINHYGFFGQDSFRVSQKLTLEYGLRWDYYPPFVDKNFNIGNFDRDFGRTGRVIIPSDPAAVRLIPTSVLQAINACPIGQLTGPSNNPGVGCTPVVTAASAGFPEGLRRKQFKNFRPRLGFAYRPFSDNKTVFRGGFGVYTFATYGSNFYSLTGTVQSDVRLFGNALSPANGAPLFSFPNTRATGQAQAVASIGTFEFRTANQTELKDPYTIQWSFTVERELPANLGLRVSYIGNRGVHLPNAPDLNQPQPSLTPFTNRPLTDRPFPNFGLVFSRDTTGTSTYNALQVELTRRFADGLTFNGAYTLSKNISDAAGPAPTGFLGENGGGRLSNSLNRRGDRGETVFNRRHRVVANAVYELPFGRGKAFGGNANRALDAAFGGWQLSGIFVSQSGAFLTPTFSGGDPSGTGANRLGSQRPDLVSGGNGNVANPTAALFFDRNAFTCPGQPAAIRSSCAAFAPIGRFGNSTVGSLIGPKLTTVSLGLGKSFKFTEQAKLRFDASFTNAFNIVNFADPNTNITSSAFGTVTGTRGGEGAPRIGQISLRFDF